MREFTIIEQLLKPLAGSDSLGLRDDAAHFKGYCLTSDVLVSGVHFFADDAPFNLARKALRVNLSDLAAMGAKPFGFMLGLVLPKGISEEWLKEFARGLQSDIAEYNCQLLGGDTNYHEDGLIISITAIGKCRQPLLRRGAKIGDNIFVSGKIGDAYLDLQAKLKKETLSKYILKYELPTPKIKLGMRLRKIASACIDVSDGLLADLGHICRESGVGAEIYSHQIPVSDHQIDLLKLISAGDDYELLFTSTRDKVRGCSKIGKIIAGEGIKLDGALVQPQGFEHSP